MREARSGKCSQGTLVLIGFDIAADMIMRLVIAASRYTLINCDLYSSTYQIFHMVRRPRSTPSRALVLSALVGQSKGGNLGFVGGIT